MGGLVSGISVGAGSWELRGLLATLYTVSTFEGMEALSSIRIPDPYVCVQ